MRERVLTAYDPKQIGKLIRHMRHVARLSQSDLGRKLDFNRGSIANMERGTHTVSLADLMRAADVCGFALRLVVTQRVK